MGEHLSHTQRIYDAVSDMIVAFTSLKDRGRIIGGHTNRLTPPADDDYAIVNILSSRRTETPHTRLEETDDGKAVNRLSQHMTAGAQVDFYGMEAQGRAADFVAWTWTPDACEICAKHGVAPVPAKELENLTGVGGEGEFVMRHTARLDFCYHAESEHETQGFTEATLTKTETLP